MAFDDFSDIISDSQGWDPSQVVEGFDPNQFWDMSGVNWANWDPSSLDPTDYIGPDFILDDPSILNRDYIGPEDLSAGAAGGLMGKILKSGQGFADLGKVLGSFADQSAKNRSTTGDFMQNYDRLMLAAAANRREDESDALKKLYQTSYIRGGGRPYHASAASPYTFGFGPQAPSDEMKQGATTLQAQLLQRLQPNGSYMPTDPSQYTKEGIGEKIGNIGALISGGLGAAGTIFGK